jgi:GT2 family glycosyltransferase
MPSTLQTLPELDPAAELPAPASLRVAVCIATRGRPGILKETLADLAAQTAQPSAVFVAYVDASDIDDLPSHFRAVHFLVGRLGLCAQRNLLLEAIGSSFDLVLFMDDDFYLHPRYLERAVHVFAQDPTVLGTSGIVLADGAKGPGLSLESARAVLAEVREDNPLRRQAARPISNTYGCNMMFRLAALHATGMQFDERLPAYGWYEDLDFSRRLRPSGRLVQVPDAYGVHLGAKVGRISGVRLGYSQVVNCVYLSKKGSYPRWNATLSAMRNVLANLVRSIAPEAYVDRRGRLRGNMLGIWDALRGRERPERILEMN